MSVFVGAAPITAAQPKAAPAKAQPRARKGRPKKAELVEEAEAMGIDVPEGATIPDILRLIEQAGG